MSTKSVLIKGTFILTFVGFLTRIMGFFYRIFMSRIFTSEEIGLYQLIFPVYALCFSFSSAGIQTALSRCTATYFAGSQKDKALQSLKIALSFSFSVSILLILFIQKNAAVIADLFLGDVRCESLLITMTYAFPFASVHSCICGYYLGQKSCKAIAVSQFLEQTFRILSVFLFIYLSMKNLGTASIGVAVWGLVIGEIAASTYVVFQYKNQLFSKTYSIREYSSSAFTLFKHATPLTANRVCLNIMQSIESISIPLKLQLFGLSSSDSLSIYGVFSGMALPFIMFPSAITNALSSMLLPTIAEFQVSRTSRELKKYVRKIIGYCSLMGTGCTLAFFLSAGFIGQYIFHNEMSGNFIRTLAFICPFLYTNTTLLSVLNGLGKTTTSFVINIVSLSIRIASVYFLIPLCGFQGYFHGLLVSQLFISAVSYIKLNQFLS